MRRLSTLAAVIGMSVLVAAPFAAAGPSTAPKITADRAAAVLFWSQDQKERGFPHMEDQFAAHTVKRGAKVHPLGRGRPLAVSPAVDGKALSLDAYMAAQKTAGLLVIQDGRVRLEKYALGYGPQGRWTSFSVAKSFTSTLVGAAIKDGFIKSLDDPVTTYIAGLKGSAYDGVTVRQLLTMTSGVKWNEDYTDPKSDVAQMFSVTPDPDTDATVSYMRKLPRDTAPGARWVYKTGETNLIGVLVTAATRKSLADYLSEKIWRPYGMARDAVWMVDLRGQEAGGCCLSVALRDYGRMGLFMLGGAKINGRAVLPEGWIAAATRKQADTGDAGHGYGYQWWTDDDGTYNAYGIFGQTIHVDPARKLVIVVSSAWPEATSARRSSARAALIAAVVAAVDQKN